MKNRTINILFIFLIIIMIPLKLLSPNIFIEYNNILWIIIITLLIITSIYFSIKLKFIQFNIPKIIGSLKGSNFNSLFVSLGAKIGVGSISGIAIAIYIAGPGVIFWLWISSIIFSILTYCECYLGVTYKDGAFNYIKKGLGNQGLGIIYALILIFSYVIGFIGIQANTVVKSINYVFNINNILIITVLIIATAIIIFKSIDKVLNFISKLVPFMCILYIILGGIILTLNIDKIVSIISYIIKDALTISTSIKSIIIIAIKRSIFATEIGIGTTSIASSIGIKDPKKEGLFQVFGIYFTALIICTITALITLVNDNTIYINNINGIELVMNIFNKYLGTFGNISLIIIIILFAFSTIIGGYYYGLKALNFINNKITKTNIIIFKLFIIVIIFLGGLVDSSIIWSLVDTTLLYLLLINIYAIIKLKSKIK